MTSKHANVLPVYAGLIPRPSQPHSKAFRTAFGFIHSSNMNKMEKCQCMNVLPSS